MDILQAKTFEQTKNRTVVTIDNIGYSNIKYFYDVANDRYATFKNIKEMSRFKGHYFLMSSASIVTNSDTIIGEPRWDDNLKCVAVKIGRLEKGRLINEGEIYYSLTKGISVKQNKKGSGTLECKPGEDRWSRNNYYIHLNGIRTENFHDLFCTAHEMSDIFRQYYKFEGTGVVLHTGYNNLYFSRERIPTALASAPVLTRYSVPMRSKNSGGYGYYTNDEGAQHTKVEADMDDTIEVDPLDAPECQAAILAELDENLKNGRCNSRRYYGSYDDECLKYAFTLALGPNPAKGTRRPIGHIYTKIEYGPYSEVFCLGYGKLSETGELHDIYLRNNEDGKYYRICNRFLTALKELIMPKMTVLRSTLDIAKNLRNKTLISTLLSGDGKCDLNSIQQGAMIRHSALFIEQLLKLGYTQIAYSMIDRIGKRQAWNETNCLGDLIPGAKEEATNIYDALGLKKAWAKWVLSKASEQCRSYADVGEYVDNARVTIAYGFDENAPSKDAMLVAEAIHQFKESHQFKSYYNNGFNAESNLVESRFNRLYSDPKSRIEIMKTYNRMVNKIKAAFANDSNYGASASLRYYSELFDDYCAIKSTGRSPEESHVFIEFGLSDNSGTKYSPQEIEEMMKRVSDNASNIYKTYESEINAELQQQVEDIWKENRKNYRGYKKEIENYVFLVPSTIYGDDAYSIKNEGEKQENCVYRSYAKRVAEGEYQIVLMRMKDKPEEACVTIGINSSGIIDQTYTYRDACISEEHARIIKLWVASLKDTKKEIRINDNPAGWCRAY